MSERETLEVDVLFVGAGPASLAGAYHLAGVAAQAKERGESPADVSILVIDKGATIGAHAISGLVLDPRGLRELEPEFEAKGFPAESPVTGDDVLYLTARGRRRLPLTPPPLRNHGNYVCSLGKLVPWLAGLCEERGVDVFPEFPGASLLYDGDRVVGVRTGDKGLDKHGQPRGNFEAGVDIRARLTVLGEGPRGSLAKTLIARHGLEGRLPQVYSLGVKEVWEVPAERFPKGHVAHTMGWPLGSHIFGGGFIYGMGETDAGNRLLSVGLVMGLDNADPTLDAHERFQAWKTHPWIRGLLEGGKVVSYGAKTIPEGGWYAMPRLYHDGVLLAGDSGGFLNSMRLKGVHLAIKSGMLAAETAMEALGRDDTSAAVLKGYQDKVEASWVKEELWGVRNFHQAMGKGLWGGMFRAGLQMLTGGRGLGADPMPQSASHTHYRKLDELRGGELARDRRIKFDGKLTFDRVTDVYYGGSTHEEDSPCHLKVADTDVCATRCVQEYGNPCQYFCPAAVYEMVDNPAAGRQELQINFSNCVHCKTCDIMDPYQIITWVTPEGGGGPKYTNL